MTKGLLKKVGLLLLPMALLATIVLPVFSSAQSGGQDCDDNAVIRCGVTSANLGDKYAENQGGNVQAVFAEFGIPDAAALQGMVSGRITRANEVFVGDTKVATDAYTAGRQDMPGSTPIMGGAFYKRPPSVSMQQDSLPALVKMDGTRFLFAIILSCGNPVVAAPTSNPGAACTGLDVVERVNRSTVKFIARASVTGGATVQAYNFDFDGDGKVDQRIESTAPEQEATHTFPAAGTFQARVTVDTTAGPQTGGECVESVTIEEEKVPGFEIIKDVRIKGQEPWQQDVTAKPNDTLEHRVTVSNTGQTELTNVVVRDTLPGGVTYADQSFKLNGNASDVGAFFGQGLNIGNIAVGQSAVMTFEVKVNANTEACGDKRMKNVAYAKPDDQPEKNDDATVQVCKPQEQPKYSCDLLIAKPLANKPRTYQFTTNTTALGGATVKRYSYTVSGPNNYNQTLTSTEAGGAKEHTFPAEGDYQVVATVEFMVGNETKSHTQDSCKTAVTIKKDTPPAVTPAVLPNTGAGAAVGLFSFSSLAGAVLFRLKLFFEALLS